MPTCPRARSFSQFRRPWLMVWWHECLLDFNPHSSPWSHRPRSLLLPLGKISEETEGARVLMFAHPERFAIVWAPGSSYLWIPWHCWISQLWSNKSSLWSSSACSHLLQKVLWLIFFFVLLCSILSHWPPDRWQISHVTLTQAYLRWH